MSPAQPANPGAPETPAAGLAWERLKEIIQERSFRAGEVVKLASGKTSDFYVDMRSTTLDPEGSTLIAQLILDAIEGEGVEFIGGLEVGAVPIVAVVGPISLQQGRTVKPFFVRKRVKQHGRQLMIEGLAGGESLKGRNVLMVDDVTTSGGSVLDAVEEVVAAGAKVVLVLAVVDRQEGAGERCAQAGYPFKALFKADDFK